jgi:hypothetical protein
VHAYPKVRKEKQAFPDLTGGCFLILGIIKCRIPYEYRITWANLLTPVVTIFTTTIDLLQKTWYACADGTVVIKKPPASCGSFSKKYHLLLLGFY